MPNRAKPTHVSAAFAGIGLTVVVLGCFLPWFRSGSVLRDSFQTAGVVNRLFEDNPLVLISMFAWIVIPLLCVVCVALYAVRLSRTAATLAIILSLLTGTIGVLGYIQSGNANGLVGVVVVGPLTTAMGSAIAILGALGVLLSCGSRAAARRGTEPPAEVA